MKRTITFLAITALVFTTHQIFSLSDGAFNMTGAPGEGDCSGCHNDAGTNTDPSGSISLTIDSANGFFVPGKSYNIKVRMAYAGRPRFGFALTTRSSGSGGLHIGTFNTGTNSSLTNRTEYVAHTQAGTMGSGQKEWTFTWKAPDTLTTPIHFYVAGVAANNDNNNTGDRVYTTQLTLQPSTVQSNRTVQALQRVARIFPVPAKHSMYLHNLQTTSPIEQVQLVHVATGQTTALLLPHPLTAGSQVELALPPVAAGMYLVQCATAHEVFVQKVVVE
jgi:hypothetical protein